MAQVAASAAEHAAAGQLADSLEQDARMALRAGASLLILGDTGPLLESIRTWLPTPLFAASPGDLPLALPNPGWTGTILIERLERLDAADQQRLHDWLGASRRRAQIVTTTAIPLLPRVEAGVFLDRLYYRLNVVCIDLTGGGMLNAEC